MNDNLTPKVIGELEGNYEIINRVYSLDGIAPSINTCGGQRKPKILQEVLMEPISTNGTDISGCIRATYYKNGERNIEENVKNGLGYEGVVESQSCAIRGRYTEDGKTQQQLEMGSNEYANALTSVSKDSMVAEPEIEPKQELKYRIRKLTERECWRLMGFSDGDFEKAAEVNSRTQLYKEAGNSIVKNVLVAIFGQLFEGKENVYKDVVTT